MNKIKNTITTILLIRYAPVIVKDFFFLFLYEYLSENLRDNSIRI